MEKTEGELLKESLCHTYEHASKKLDMKQADDFCEGYKDFLNEAKTERECVSYFIEHSAYKPFERGTHYHTGDKIYYNNRGKALILVTMGEQPLSNGVHFNIAHIDSPRLDLKANPLYEKEDLAYLRTHYYGGIRKYQWPTIPLALHGVVVLEDGKKIQISIGERDDEPKFVITDLLPHLSGEQNTKKLSEAFTGEDLVILCGSLPYEDEKVKEKVKLQILNILHDVYGMKEKDFVRAELEMVPAYKATDIGLDRSLIGAYAQDDRVCAYPAFMAEIENVNPEKTSVTVLTDKEEIGSEGNTGMVSEYLFDFLRDLGEAYGIKLRDILRNSICMSSDVNAAYDPSFSNVFDLQNSSKLNCGPVITKYTGARGKSASNDASAETMAEIIRILDRQDIPWQTGELGKVDAGGGGTIAKYMAQRNVDTVDLGIPVMSMHSPFEITSKLDVYATYLAYKAFIK